MGHMDKEMAGAPAAAADGRRAHLQLPRAGHREGARRAVNRLTGVPGIRLRLPDGRHLGWCERGDPNGHPVFAFHGLPGSRHQAHPDDSIAVRAGARVIHVDRPGFGLSDEAPARTLKDWAADVQALADHLGMSRFALMGISGGGPFACACACELGERVTRTALIASVGPPGTMSRAQSWVSRAAFALARDRSVMLEPALSVAGELARRAPRMYVSSLIARLPPCDQVILCRPVMRALLVRDMFESLRHGPAGLLRDLQLEAAPWDLRFARVSCPVVLWHGGRDTVVPPSAVDALAALLPHAQVRRFPEAGHFFVFDAWEEILGWVMGRS